MRRSRVVSGTVHAVDLEQGVADERVECYVCYEEDWVVNVEDDFLRDKAEG